MLTKFSIPTDWNKQEATFSTILLELNSHIERNHHGRCNMLMLISLWWCCRLPQLFSLLYIIHTPTLSPPWYHSVTLFCTVTCYTSLSSHIHPSLHPPLHPCTAWGRVRTCRLPLIWVSATQFSGRLQTSPMTHTTTVTPLFPHLSWAQDVSATPHMVLKVPTHASPTPTGLPKLLDFLYLNLSLNN